MSSLRYENRCVCACVLSSRCFPPAVMNHPVLLFLLLLFLVSPGHRRRWYSKTTRMLLLSAFTSEAAPKCHHIDLVSHVALHFIYFYSYCDSFVLERDSTSVRSISVALSQNMKNVYSNNLKFSNAFTRVHSDSAAQLEVERKNGCWVKQFYCEFLNYESGVPLINAVLKELQYWAKVFIS